MTADLQDPGPDSNGTASSTDLPAGYADHLRARHRDVVTNTNVPSAVDMLTNAERRAASDGHRNNGRGPNASTNDRHARQRRILLVTAALVLLAGAIGILVSQRSSQNQTHFAGLPEGEQDGGGNVDRWNGMPMLFPDDPSRTDDEYLVMSMIGADGIYGTPSPSEPLWVEAYAAGDVGEQLRFISLQSFADIDAEQMFSDLMTLPGPLLDLLSPSRDTSLDQMEAELNAGFNNLWGETGEPDAARSSVKVEEIPLPPSLTMDTGRQSDELWSFQVHMTELYGITLNRRLIFIEPRPTDTGTSVPISMLSMSGVDDAVMMDVINGLQVVDGRIRLGSAPEGFAPILDGALWHPDGDFSSYSAWRSSGGGATGFAFSEDTSMLSVINAGAGSASYLTSVIGALSGQRATVIRTRPDWMFAVDTLYMVGIRDGMVIVLTNPPEPNPPEVSGASFTGMTGAWDRITEVDRDTFEAALGRSKKLMSEMSSPDCVTEDVECGPIEPAVTTTIVGEASDTGD